VRRILLVAAFAALPVLPSGCGLLDEAKATGEMVIEGDPGDDGGCTANWSQATGLSPVAGVDVELIAEDGETAGSATLEEGQWVDASQTDCAFRFEIPFSPDEGQRYGVLMDGLPVMGASVEDSLYSVEELKSGITISVG
jgi:hypothetical protein